MNSKIKTVIAAASMLALSAVSANAQLLLNTITSTFSGQVGSVGTTTTSNGGPNAPSSIAFNPTTGTTFTLSTAPSLPQNMAFTPLPNSWTFDLWTLDFSNTASPVTATTLSSTNFNFAVDFFGGATPDININFNIGFSLDTTGVLPAVTYTTTNLSPLKGTFVDGGVNYMYEVTANGLNGSLFSGQNSSNGVAHIDIALGVVPVPEPSTYALCGVVGLMGVIAVRRLRRSQAVV